jgi:hypothetical protein
MSKTEQKKLKGIVSISSDDFYSMNNKGEKPKNNNNQKNKIISTEPNKKTIKKKPVSKPTPSSTSSSRSIQLPDNFFEQILDCEFKLKEKFDPKTFYELINLYSSAINFYESIKDPRFITYNQSLNLLFSLPEVKKFMEGKKSLTKTEKINDIEKRMLQSEKKITKEKVNKIYLSKIQKNFGKNIISEEFNKQSNLFKKRKEEKKQKYLLSTSALPRIKKESLNKENNNLEEKNNNKIKNLNKSVDIRNQQNDEDNEDEEEIKPKKIYKTSAKKHNPINLNFFGENNVLDELKKEDLNNEINKITINNSGNDSDKNNDDTLSFTNSDNLLIDVNKIQRMTNKTLFQENLKSNLDSYISDFYNIFLDKIMNSIVKDYTDSGNNIEKKLIDSSIEFLGQKKQMEYLRDESENDATYNDQLESMIQQILDEDEESKMKIINEGEQREKILNDKYINSIETFQNHKMEMLKEKLKLDVTKAVNSFVLK